MPSELKSDVRRRLEASEDGTDALDLIDAQAADIRSLQVNLTAAGTRLEEVLGQLQQSEERAAEWKATAEQHRVDATVAQDQLAAACRQVTQQAAVFDRVRERLGWLLKRAQCDGFVTVSELAEEIEALAAAPEATAPEECCSDPYECWKELRGQLTVAESQVTNLTYANDQRRQVIDALESKLAAANARVAELEALNERTLNERDIAHDALVSMTVARDSALDVAADISDQRDAANARVAELESRLEKEQERSTANADMYAAANARAYAAERQRELAVCARGTERQAHEITAADRDAWQVKCEAMQRSLLLQSNAPALDVAIALRRAESEAAALRAEVERLKGDRKRRITRMQEAIDAHLKTSTERDAANARADAAERKWSNAVENEGQAIHDRKVAESEAAALRAEVERLRAEHADLAKTYGEKVDEWFVARADLAAANALLERCKQWAVDNKAWVLRDKIGAHFSGQAPARTDHERAVLEAMGELPAADMRETVALDELKWPHLCKVFRAELARRDGKP